MDGGGTAGTPAIPGMSGLVELGHTPAAITYRGVDATGRSVVVKVLQRDATPEVRARFDYDQARLTELVDHPDIVDNLTHGYTADNKPYIVMAELGGGSMAERVGSGMDGPGVLAVGIKMAGALESAHRRNLIHGDLRPDDVLITDDGEPHIADLGVALVTGLGPDRATTADGIAHAAPEQIRDHIPTIASDIYALGSVLYALLAGAPAFVRPGDAVASAVALRIAGDPPPDLRPAGIPEAVIEVIERAMAKSPEDRWESAEAMGHALQQAEVTLGLPITPMNVVGTDLTPARPDAQDAAPQAAPSTPSSGGSKKGLLIGGALVVVAAVVAGALLLGGGDDGGGDDDDATPFTRPEAEEVDLTEATDDTGVITVGIIDRWDDVNGEAFFDDGTTVVPDVVAAEGDAAAFFGEGGFDVSGIEVTFFPAGSLVAVEIDATDAAGLRDERVAARSLAQDCATELPPSDLEIDGFAGELQRFEDCDGTSIEVFAGFDGDDAIVVEMHLVDADDEAVVEQVLESIAVDR